MPEPTQLQTIAERAEAAITARFADAVRAFASDVALTCADRVFTYRELNCAANRVAHAIIERAGIGRKPVILLADRAEWGVVGLLGILKAGKFCVPIQPSNNEDRMLEAVLVDMSHPVVVTYGKWAVGLSNRVAPEQVIDVASLDATSNDSEPVLDGGPDDLAFVIYTSGSTGAPKGVMHNHRNILHRIYWYAARFNVGPADRTIMLSSAEHISGVVGVLRPLLTGGRLHIFDIRTDGFHGLVRAMQEQRITLLPIINTVFRRFSDSLDATARFPDLRMIILGGERLLMSDVERYRRLFPDTCLLLNTLGCTELPTYRYLVIDKSTPIVAGPIPAGYPVPDIDVTIVDTDGNVMAEGGKGEIVVRSRYLSLGYWNRPTETAARFGSAEQGQRTFRTGDLGAMRHDDVLLHLGRDDWMVKILGNRVELGEVEEAIRQHPAIRDAAVTTWPGPAAGPRLYAYVVARPGKQPTSIDIKAWLRERLPDYMIPFDILTLSELPLTRSGKINRRALPAPDLTRSPARPSYLPPRDDLEQTLVGIWESLLNVSPIGVHDNFFHLGGDSLLAVSMSASLEKQLKTTLLPTILAHTPTIEGFARAIRADAVRAEAFRAGVSRAGHFYSLVPVQTGGSLPPLFAIHHVNYRGLARHLGPDQPVYGLRYAIGVGLAKPIPLPMVPDLARHYMAEIRQVQPQGPYHLVGHSFGGVVAYEIAQQLTAIGQKVESLTLLDSQLENNSKPLPFGSKVMALAGLTPSQLVRTLAGQIRRSIDMSRRLSRWRNGTGYRPDTFNRHETVAAWKAYKPAPYAGRTNLLLAKDRPKISLFHVPIPPERAWRALVSGPFDVFETPGTHLTLLDEPNVEILARQLRLILARVAGDAVVKTES